MENKEVREFYAGGEIDHWKVVGRNGKTEAEFAHKVDADAHVMASGSIWLYDVLPVWKDGRHDFSKGGCMERKAVKEWLASGGQFTGLGQLVSLRFTYDGGEAGMEGFNVVFAVPTDWLIQFLDGKAGRREWDWDRLAIWLESGYGNEDSFEILETAWRAEKIALWRVI